jgi:hypothetical protein
MFTNTLFAQSIHLNNNDGSNSSYNLDDVRKLTLDNNRVQVFLKNGNMFEYTMAALQNYRYSESSLSITEILMDVNDQMALEIYPNPTSNDWQLKFNLLTNEVVTCVLYDTNGKEILIKSFGHLMLGEQKHRISASHLASGNYILKLQGKSFVINKKIVKL